MDNGWIKMHRSLLNWEWFSDYKTSHLFNYLLLKASHNEYKWKGKTYYAGQLPFGLNKAAIETGLSVKMIRTSLEKLKSSGEVAIKTSNQGSVITIKNWEKYQSGASVEANQEASKGQARGKQRATTKNEKNEKNKDSTNKKPSKQNSFSTELINLFDDHEIISWLKETGSGKIQSKIYDTYNHSFLKDEIENAFYWQQENKKRKAGTFLKGWMERSNSPNKINKQKKLDELNQKLIELAGGLDVS